MPVEGLGGRDGQRRGLDEALSVGRAIEVLRVLARDGWEVTRQSGSPAVLRHPTKPGRVVVPRHVGTIKVGLMAGILKQAGLTAEDFRRLR